MKVEYKKGDSVTLKDGSKWHVIKDSSSSSASVTLLSDYNLNSDATYNTSCGKDINNTTNCAPQVFDLENNRPQSSNSYCLLAENGCNIYEQNGSGVLKDSTVKTWLDTVYLPLLKQSLTNANGNLESLSVSLPTMEELALADNQTFEQNQITFNASFLTTTNYWTKTASTINSAYVWNVVGEYNNSYVQNASENTKTGVRPVVVVSKENINR